VVATPAARTVGRAESGQYDLRRLERRCPEVLHLERVRARIEIGVSPRVQIAGAARARVHGQQRVGPDPAVIVARDRGAGRVMESQKGIRERAAAARTAALVDDVIVAGEKLDGKPIVIAGELHAGAQRASGSDRPSRAGVAEIVVDDRHIVEHEPLDLVQRIVSGAAAVDDEPRRRLREREGGTVPDEARRVKARAAVQKVVPAAAFQVVVIGTADEGVRAATAFERIVTGPAAEVVVGVVTGYGVVTRAAIGVLDERARVIVELASVEYIAARVAAVRAPPR
jgi:hypothetical protein